MRKALVVGIDHYENMGELHGCVNDAYAVKSMLERHGDGTPNFDVQLVVGTGPSSLVTRSKLRDSLRELFAGDCETALFYFAGHGHVESTGGYLLSGDASTGDDGVPLADLMSFANKSRASNRIIALDSCYSGSAAVDQRSPEFAEIKEGTTILTASTAEQYAAEDHNSGVFTTLLVDALAGAAANLIGEVTPGGIYAHIDKSLGPWSQRPVFKTNVKTFVALRRVQPMIDPADLRRIAEMFPQSGIDFPLDPSFEPERGSPEDSIPQPDPINNAKFAILQKLNRVGLVVPVDAPHMWHAAMNSKACRLTALGEHYRKLVERGRI